MTSINLIFILSYIWWRDTERESTNEGDHRGPVKTGLKLGIIFFISSEVIFFLSFFWTFIHRRRSSDIELGIEWPPNLIFPFNPLGVPLINTIILLSSGASITWCHHASLKNFHTTSSWTLSLTIILGIMFSLLQATEYILSPFSLSDGVMGSIFFVATGFHGLHVLIGTSFLTIVLFKLNHFVNTSTQNTGFECAAWYWHFVDVVWLFLYSLIYWWGR